MNAPELAKKFRDYRNHSLAHGNYELSDLIANYVEEKICPTDQTSNLWRRTEEYLPTIANRVIEKLRETRYGRSMFTSFEQTDGFFDPVPDFALVDKLRYTIEDVVSKEASLKVDQIVSAELNLLFVTFDRFLQKVYVEGGLRERVASAPYRTFAETFGEVIFNCFFSDGRVRMTFYHNSGKRGGNISFYVDESEPHLGIGLQQCYATYRIARENIEEVMDKWLATIRSS